MLSNTFASTSVENFSIKRYHKGNKKRGDDLARFNKQVLIKARTNRSLTVRKLGSLLGVSGVTITRYETGERQPDLEMIEKIADVFKMNWTDFILMDKIMTTNENYQLTLKMEVLKEQAAISRQLTALKIDTETDPLYVLYLQVGYVETTQILLAKDEQELNRIQGYLEGVKQYIELLKTTQEVA